MGIQYLNRILRTYASNGITEKSLFNLKGKTIAIDISIYLYRYKSEDALIENIYTMISLFKYYNIIPLFVFDGKPPIEKNDTLKERRELKKKAKLRWDSLNESLDYHKDDNNKVSEILEAMDKEKKNFIKISKNDINNVKELMEVYGVAYITAEGEADELCAKLVKKRIAYGCFSEDMDLFVYGTSRVYRYFSLLNSTVVEYNLKIILEELNLNITDFQQICVLSGTDYNIDNKMNIYKAFKLFKKYKKSKENNTFYNWLIDNSKLKDIIQFNNVLNMFKLTNININMIKQPIKYERVDKNALHHLLESYGFIYPKNN
jgi:flap endonuclease-1|tara:strand:- start:1343 stop:2296 length:954 start_codon:yes stop_codon:yes gene_type:complete